MRGWLQHLFPPGSPQAVLADVVEVPLKIVLIVGVYFVARWLAGRALDAVLVSLAARARAEGEASVTRIRTLELLARSAIRYALLFVVAVTLLSELGINVATILTGAGVAGLAISFGAQRLVRDVLTGFFLLIEDQFRVGEVVTLVGSPGLPQINGNIQEMGLRLTRLLDESGKLVTIGNGDIAVVINHSRGPVKASVELGVTADAPPDRIREVVAGLALPPELFAGPASVEGVTALDAAKMTLRLAAPAAPGKSREAELHLRQAAGEALRRAGVEVV